MWTTQKDIPPPLVPKDSHHILTVFLPGTPHDVYEILIANSSRFFEVSQVLTAVRHSVLLSRLCHPKSMNIHE